MSALANLLRISRWQLDEKRRTLADLERLQEKLRGDLARLDAALLKEQEVAQNSDATRRAFPAYAEAELARRRRLEQSIAGLEREIAEAREAVAEAFREAKKYELAKNNEEQRKRQLKARIEQSAMDETGLQLYRRKKGT